MTTERRPVRKELSRAPWRRVRAQVRARDGDRCRVCGSDGWIPAHISRSGRIIPGRRVLIVGHIIPAERYPGSHDDPTNLRTMCVACNNSQGDKTDDEWRAALAARGDDRAGAVTAPRTIYVRRPSVPATDRPDPPRPQFRAHLHNGPSGYPAIAGNMSIRPPWPNDGTCPPECPLSR